MKNTILDSKLFLMAICAVVIMSCSGDDGIDGAIGPQGVAGTDGTDGTNGEDGNANVMDSGWTLSEFSSTASSFDSFEIVDSKITQETMDSSAVFAFGKIGTSTISIPFVFRNKSYYFNIRPATTSIRFIANSIDSSMEVYNDFSEVRYIIIPSSTASKSNQPDFSKMDYWQIIDHFGLDD
ncbi:hypothetical protein H0I25_05230 [Cellulophaga sp. HaHa_2_95]|uniref:hypothetical protein n=1 Tax=unclassified Cellulophaga TaxID=2634405 RepID=UPI001C4E6478|nr:MULTISPECIES: hypothetical protein [unclassified Cellulophaga]QXP50493.1 hypothetical protein H0I24_10000 [Cellulophaga sp. HaHa_2_1]QXP57196.1 hypothetical protein H0I25_05230 [Cellulophaga sp. HaHa_2_95]